MISISYGASMLGLIRAKVLHFTNRICGGLMAVFLLLFYSTSCSYAESAVDVQTLSVAIVQSEDGGSYQEFSDALRKVLGDKGLANVEIDFSKSIPNAGLVIAVGMKAATAVAASNVPVVLNVMIPKAGYEKLLRDFPLRASSHTFSAIFLDQPVFRQVHLITASLPGKRNVGLLYSSPPDELARLRKELTEHGLNLQEQTVKPDLPLSESLQDLLQNSDVLIALPDAVVYNSSTIRNVLLATYRSGIPLIGFSSGYVKAGALCAAFSTPLQIARQAASIIGQFSDKHVLASAQYPLEFEVLVNQQVAYSLGLHIKGAAELHDLVSTEDRREP